jgi:pimeloyl-ACP methyl ester carboxylesterase
MIRRFWFRACLILVILGVGSVVVFGWLASSAIICPNRRPIQDHQREILANPAAHGLVIREFATPQDGGGPAPCLLCEPAAAPMSGEAKKGRILREQLAARGIVLRDWGQVSGTLVLLHGHKGRKEDFLPVAQRFCAAGLRCLCVDLPAQGENPLPYATFGKGEAKLAGAVLDQAQATFGFAKEPAALFGLSQGGAIAWQSVEQGPWCAIASLAAFANLGDVIDAKAKTVFGPFHGIAFEVARTWCRVRANFDPVDVQPERAASRVTNLPVLIGHGVIDDFVPASHASRLFASCPSPDKQLLMIEGGTHTNVFITPAPVYATMAEFYLRAMAPR